MISPQRLPFLHPSHLVVAFIDRPPTPFREGLGEYVLLFIYPFGFILLAVLPFIGAISRLYAMAQIATAAGEDDAFLIICPSKTCPEM